MVELLDELWRTLLERLRQQVAALERKVDAVDALPDALATYRRYYLTLKKDLRAFEQAADEVQYGQIDRQSRDKSDRKSSSSGEEEVDLLELGEVHKKGKPVIDTLQVQPDRNAEEDLLDLTVQAPDTDLLEKVDAVEVQPTQLVHHTPVAVPMPEHREAFDFLSDSPSEWHISRPK